MKIGSITCNWNGERFIRPHLDMLQSGGVDRSIVLQGSEPWANYANEHGISYIPDNSEDIILKEYPKVEVYGAKSKVYGAELYNQGLEILSECDIVLRLDYDMFMTERDWDWFIEYIKLNRFDCYRVAFNNCTINYYYDCDHGVKDAKEYDAMAVNPKGRFSGTLDYNYGRTKVIDWDNWVIHHMRGWKGFTNSKDWVDEVITDTPFIAKDVREKYGKDGKWFVAPDEIKDKLCKSQ